MRLLDAYKASRGLYSFSDLLTTCLSARLRLDPAPGIAFIDEAQDLSPLQIALVHLWFDECPRGVVIAGDDDQCIYGFQAADPGWLVRQAAAAQTLGRTTVLAQSFRVPAGPCALGQAAIRGNRVRVPKDYRPRAPAGNDPAHDVLTLARGRLVEHLVAAGERTVLVLARHRYTLAALAYELLDRGVPYLLVGGGAPCPLADEDLRAALETCARAGRGEAMFSLDIFQLKPYLSFPAGLLEGVQLGADVPSQTMAWLSGRVSLLGAAGALDQLDRRIRRYLAAVVTPGGELPRPSLRLMTIHAAKGDEADTVFIIPEMLPAAMRALRDHAGGGAEGEHRIAYVAITRARRQLVLVEPSTARFYDYGALLRRGPAPEHVTRPDGATS